MTSIQPGQFAADPVWLKNAHVPRALLPEAIAIPTDRDGLATVDIEIRQGKIAQIQPAGRFDVDAVPSIDLQRRMVWPCFVDMHTHLDKGHIWGRSPNLSGRFEDALETVQLDRETNWSVEDVYRRMEFGVRCSYAHGTIAIRTHIDTIKDQAKISLEAFKALRQTWGDRMLLQAVSLVPIDVFMTPEGEALADLIADAGGILGGLPVMGPELDAQLDRVFALAKERQLNLDFHTDESGDASAITLRHVAQAVVRHQFEGSVVCGHCCSLAVQSQADVNETMSWVKRANIGIVSLPMCNLYLQDRNQRTSRGWLGALDAAMPTHTPRWRGVTLVHELKHSGIPVAVASDNCRDPFFAFGDHDMLEVFTHSARIAHFDAPYGDWCRTVTATPADLMGLPNLGRLQVGASADLVVFKARYYSELLSRPQSDRIVLRNGQPIDTTLPDYAELDDLVDQPMIQARDAIAPTPVSSSVDS